MGRYLSMFAALHLLGTESDPNSTVDLLLGLVVTGLLVAWPIGSILAFRKAGAPWWSGITPGWYFKYVADLSGVELWGLVVFWPLRARARYALALRFGRSRQFASGLALAPIVFYPILGFGKATYSGQNLISSR